MTPHQALAEYAHLSTRIARRLAGGGADVDDLVQAGRLGLVTAATHWDGASPFGAFATVCVRNAVRAAAKSARRLARYDVTAPIDDDADEGAPVDASQELAPDLSRLRAAIAELPPRERTILGYVTQGWNAEEIGAHVKLTGCRVRQLVTAFVRDMSARMGMAARETPKPAPKVNRGAKPRRLLEYKGRALTKAQWAREAGISYMTLSRRLADGWSLADALETSAVRGRPAAAVATKRPNRVTPPAPRRRMATRATDFAAICSRLANGATLRDALGGAL